MCLHYYFFEKLKIVGKQLCKLNCFYGTVSHTLNIIIKSEMVLLFLNYLKQVVRLTHAKIVYMDIEQLSIV